MLITTAAGSADLSFEKPTPAGQLFSNVFLSLSVVQGSWWFNPSFGMRDTRRLKNTPRNARLVEAWVKEALQWLLDLGRASAVAVETERDPLQNPGRLKAVITVTPAHSDPVTFTKFFEVA